MMLVTVVCIGNGLKPDDKGESYVSKLKSLGWERPKDNIRYGSTFYASYFNDCMGEPLNLTEYTCRLSSSPSVYCM